LIPELAGLFPDARFVHLVRDGRKVAGSYFHKLGRECYDDRSTAILANYLNEPDKRPCPPPEKKYWWPQPQAHAPWAEGFPNFDRFDGRCWHWAEVNRVIRDGLEPLDDERKLLVRLEDLREQPSLVARLFTFLDRPYRDTYFSAFARPHNVNRPIDTPLTKME